MAPAEHQETETFRAAYHGLEARLQALAEADGDIYLPNVEPAAPAQFVFIGMEPSLGRWATSPEEARAKVREGFRNFVSSIEDFILHFCIRRYLCEGGERYHITDLSKGAMLVERASVDRTQRYDRWYELLADEIELVAAPGAGIFAVGNDVRKHLSRRAFPRPITPVIHYSGLAGAARAAGIVGHEGEFEHFRNSIALEDVLATAETVLNESVPPRFKSEALTRLRAAQLTESRKQLAFNYKLAFERQKHTRRRATNGADGLGRV